MRRPGTGAIRTLGDCHSSSSRIAPVILGAGKRLFDGFTKSLDLEHLGVRQPPFATFIDYRVKPVDKQHT